MTVELNLLKQIGKWCHSLNYTGCWPQFPSMTVTTVSTTTRDL